MAPFRNVAHTLAYTSGTYADPAIFLVAVAAAAAAAGMSFLVDVL